jgi:lauroyl/myristoyl acyltransferase
MKSIVPQLQRLSYAYENSARFLGMELVLGPAAEHLPLDVGLRRAKALARFLVATTFEGRTLRREMEHAFDCSPERAAALAEGWFERQPRDFVFLRRVASGQPLPSLENVRHAGSAVAMELASQPGPLIIATGHFAREAAIAFYSARHTPGPVNTVWAAVSTETSYRPYPLRMGLQFGTLLAAVRAVRGDAGRFIHTEEKGAAFAQLAQILTRDREKINVCVDSYWHKGRSTSYDRPFAGRATTTFSTGPARLARVTQTPVVLCVPYVAETGEIVLEWSGPFAPSAPHLADDDYELTDLLLGLIEHAVGQRPTQYVMEVGGERVWDAGKRRWGSGGDGRDPWTGSSDALAGRA